MSRVYRARLPASTTDVQRTVRFQLTQSGRASVCGVGRAGCRLDHQAHDDVVGVRVAMLRPGVGNRAARPRRTPACPPAAAARSASAGMPGQIVVLREIRDAAGVTEELAQRHRRPARWLRRQPAADRVVQRQRSLVHERQGDPTNERLRHARDAHEVIRARRLGLDETRAAFVTARAARSESPGRSARRRNQLAQRAVECRVGHPWRRRRRVCGSGPQQCKHGNDTADDERGPSSHAVLLA